MKCIVDDCVVPGTLQANRIASLLHTYGLVVWLSTSVPMKPLVSHVWRLRRARGIGNFVCGRASATARGFASGGRGDWVGQISRLFKTYLANAIYQVDRT